MCTWSTSSSDDLSSLTCRNYVQVASTYWNWPSSWASSNHELWASAACWFKWTADECTITALFVQFVSMLCIDLWRLGEVELGLFAWTSLQTSRETPKWCSNCTWNTRHEGFVQTPVSTDEPQATGPPPHKFFETHQHCIFHALRYTSPKYCVTVIDLWCGRNQSIIAASLISVMLLLLLHFEGGAVRSILLMHVPLCTLRWLIVEILIVLNYRYMVRGGVRHSGGCQHGLHLRIPSLHHGVSGLGGWMLNHGGRRDHLLLQQLPARKLAWDRRKAPCPVPRPRRPHLR